jgi:hypothetical protein
MKTAPWLSGDAWVAIEREGRNSVKTLFLIIGVPSPRFLKHAGQLPCNTVVLRRRVRHLTTHTRNPYSRYAHFGFRVIIEGVSSPSARTCDSSISVTCIFDKPQASSLIQFDGEFLIPA